MAARSLKQSRFHQTGRFAQTTISDNWDYCAETRAQNLITVKRKNRNFGKHTDRKKGSIRANDKYLNTGEGLKPRTHLTRIVRAKIR